MARKSVSVIHLHLQYIDRGNSHLNHYQIKSHTTVHVTIEYEQFIKDIRIYQCFETRERPVNGPVRSLEYFKFYITAE